MNRKTTIATVVATTGVFAATVVAGVSIMQASVASDPATELPVLAAGSSLNTPTADLSYTPLQLPELPAMGSPAAATNTGNKSGSENASANLTISRASARSIVLAATDGRVTGIDKVTRSGMSAFAVTVARSDGSVITGYVDTTTGTIFDWVTNKKAPTPTTTYNDDDDDHDEEHDSDEHEEHEGDEDDD